MIIRNDDETPIHLIGEDPGPATLPLNRRVHWTGRVAIGARAEPWKCRDIGTEAERLQTALIGGLRVARPPHRVPFTRRDWADVGHALVPWVSLALICGIAAALIIERLS